jgi:hypothetical protein
MLSCVGAAGCVDTRSELFRPPPFTPPSPQPAPAQPSVPNVAPDATLVMETMAPETALDPTASSSGAAEPGPGGTAAEASAEPAGDGTAPAVPADQPAAGTDPSAPSVEEDPTGQARLCPAVIEPLLLDFAGALNSPSQALFGDFQGTLSGGTYVYPETSAVAEGEVQPLGLVSDVTEGDWHLSGSVTQPAGFGLFLDCNLLDASRFVGLAFRIAGTIGEAGSLSFRVGIAADDVSRAWLLAHGGSTAPSFGRCTPEQSEFDGTCNSPGFELAVSAESRDVFVSFSALRDGAPEPGVNPAELTKITWALPTPIADAAGAIEPVAIDLRIDDIRWVEEEPAVQPE